MTQVAGYLLADNNSLQYAYRSGGLNLIKSYIATAQSYGLRFVITDQVEYEISRGPLSNILPGFFAANDIPVISTSTYAAFQAGLLPSKNAG